ncbi:Dynamin family protein OS=Ureibacillus acetophenoni OX=614649 GN=SAMN05877842_103268 PE=4 SV=1 [Ureibacillus acetophenoni]
MIQVNKETRDEANKQSNKWKKELEQDLSEIRLFDPSMLNQSKNEVENFEDLSNHTVVEKMNGEEVIHVAIRTANAVGKINGFEEVSSFLKEKGRTA